MGKLLSAADGAVSQLLLSALCDQHPGDSGGPDKAPGAGSPLEGPLAGPGGGGDPDRGRPALWPAPRTGALPGREGPSHGPGSGGSRPGLHQLGGGRDLPGQGEYPVLLGRQFAHRKYLLQWLHGVSRALPRKRYLRNSPTSQTNGDVNDCSV